MNAEKSHISACTWLYFLFQANRPLTRQLEAVIIEVSMAQVLTLRTNPWRVDEAKYLPPKKSDLHTVT